MEAEKLCNRAYFLFIKLFTQIQSFRETAYCDTEAIRDRLLEKALPFSSEFFTKPENDRFFIDRQGAIDAIGGPSGLAETLTRQSINNFKLSVDAASIVFAHSIIDGLAFNLCNVTVIADPEYWENKVIDKKDTLNNFKTKSYKDILKEFIDRYLDDLDRKSLITKIDHLFSVCKPKPGSIIDNYKYDKEFLEQIDKLRHDIVHGDKINTEIPEITSYIKYMEQTGSYITLLLCDRFNFKLDPTVRV